MSWYRLQLCLGTENHEGKERRSKKEREIENIVSMIYQKMTVFEWGDNENFGLFVNRLWW